MQAKENNTRTLAHIGLLLIVLLSISMIVNADFVPNGKRSYAHCWYLILPAPVATMNVDFVGGQELTVTNDSGVLHLVAPGTTLSLSNISSFQRNCTDGAITTEIEAVRVMRVFPDGTVTEIAANYGTNYGGGCDLDTNNPSADLGIMHGTTRAFNVMTFSTEGTYTLRPQYATSISGGTWANVFENDINVTVAKPELKFSAEEGYGLVGVEKSVYANVDANYTGTLLWTLKNTGLLPVQLVDINALGCEDGFTCQFTNFDANASPPTVIDVNQQFILRQKVTANRPAISPTTKYLSLIVSYTDTLGFLLAPITTDTVTTYPDKHISFKINAAIKSPSRKVGTFTVDSSDVGKTFYAQSCTDSKAETIPEINYLNQNLVYAVEIYKPGAIDAANRVANAWFHQVSSCTSTTDLAHLNSLEGLARFVPDVNGTYTYVISGDSGVNDGNYAYYVSDFIKIGTTFDSNTQTITSPLVTDSLGAQHLVQTSTSDLPFIINASMQSTTLSIPTLPTNGDAYQNDAYTLKNFTVDGNVITAGPTQHAAGGLVQIDMLGTGLDTKVQVSTSALGSSDSNTANRLKFPITLLWTDKEKYVMEFNAGATGLCRNLQGDALATDDALSLTGAALDPLITYDWKISSIAPNECEPTTLGKPKSVCDATQFSIMLLKKLDMARKLGADGNAFGAAATLEPFTAYLMHDGFSSDFRNDFDVEMKKRLFATDVGVQQINYAYPSPNTGGWTQYFLDNNRLQFNKTTLGKPGLYRITIDYNFAPGKEWQFFDNTGNPIASLKVNFSTNPSTDEPEPINLLPANVLYYLPMDGTVGLTDALTYDRKGYGVGFKPATASDIIPLFPDTNGSSTFVKTYAMTPESTPITALTVEKMSSFENTGKNFAGRILFISEDTTTDANNDYRLVYSPSNAIPVIVRADSNAGSISAGYALSDQSSSTETFIPTTTTGYARLVESAYFNNNIKSCTDPTTQSTLPAFAQTEVAYNSVTTAQCTLGTVNGATFNGHSDRVFTINRPSTDGNVNIYYQTVFYTPTGKNIVLSNVCANQGKFYVSTLDPTTGRVTSAITSVAPGQLTPMVTANAFGYLDYYLKQIKDGYVCLAVGTKNQSSEPLSLGMWWNEQKVISDFMSKLPASNTIPANVCAAH